LGLALAVACQSARTQDPAGPGGDFDTDQDGDGGGDGDEPLRCTGTSAVILVGTAQTLDPIVEDPERCLLYGVDRTGNQVYVIDTIADEVRASPVVGNEPVDLTLSASGAQLYVAVKGASAIAVLDATSGSLIKTVPTTIAPYRIARGIGSRLFYVEEVDYTAVRMVDVDDETDEQVTTFEFHEPDLEASADGSSLFLGEGNMQGSRLFRFDPPNFSLDDADSFLFEGGFTLPSPDRKILLAADSGRVYFADRAFADDDLERMLGWFGSQVVAASENGKVVATAESLHDAVTFVRFADRQSPDGGAIFSHDNVWLYEFDAVGSVLRRSRVNALVGAHHLGQTAVAAGSLSQRRFNQFVADPARPVLYGIDSQANELVVIDRDTLVPLRAELIGSAPTDLAISADGGDAVVATFGATEFVVLDLDDPDKAFDLAQRLPGNPFRITISSQGQVAYAEQDQYSDLGLFDLATSELVAVQGATIFQPDIEFDSSGQYLFAGESAGPTARLYKFDLAADTFAEVDVSELAYSYPSRRLFYNSGSVYYAGRRFAADDLAELGDFGADIVCVTPDGAFALSRRHVYDTTTFLEVGGLPTDSNLVTVDPDSTTVYQFDNEIGALFVQSLPSD
jgi:DNA-binding beta-propeller fold protein YncE